MMGNRRHSMDRGKQARNSGHDKKKMVAAAMEPAGALYNQGTTQDTASFDHKHDAMAEYVRVLLDQWP